MKGRSTSTIVAFILLGIAAVAIAFALMAIRPPETLVLKPKEPIQAYRLVTLDDFEQVAVPETEESVTENELTAEWFAKQVEGKKPVFFTQNLLPGQRLDKRLLGSDPQGSLSIASPDERLVIVSGSAAGTLGGLLRPGDVVQVQTTDGEVSSDFAKVIAFGVGGDVGSSAVVREGAGEEGGGEQAQGQGGQVLVLLAVVDGDAPQLAGKDATLTLNPHCRITAEGFFVAAGDGNDDECRPAGRAASEGPAEGESNEEPTQEIDPEDEVIETDEADAESDATTEDSADLAGSDNE